MLRLVNLTPHELKLYDEDGRLIVTLPPSGQIARVSTKEMKIGELDGEVDSIPVFTTMYGDVEGLPPREEDTYYIVSRMVLNHPSLKDREDVFAPGKLLRDENGRVIGAVGLVLRA